MNNIPYPKTTSIADIQKAVIKDMLDAKEASGEIKSRAEYERELNEAYQKIEGGVLFTEGRTQSGTTDADSFNETFRELGIDLASIFEVLNRLEESSVSHTRLNQSTLNNVNLRAKAIENELTRQEKLLGKRSIDDLYVETFSVSNGFEQKQEWYQERNGQLTPFEYRAAWEPASESVRLPTAFSDNLLTGKNGVRLGSLRITKQLGAEQMKFSNPLQGIENAIDRDNASYWSESILMDQPIEVELGSDHHNLDFGAAFELEARFDQLSIVNELTVNPFAEYPMDLVAITAYETDDPEEVGAPILSTGGKPIILEGERLFRFPDRSVKRIRILFNQRHYVKRDFLVSGKDRRNLELRLQAKEGRAEIKGLKAATADEVLDIIRQNETKRLTKVEYQYGLYNLSFGRNEFHTTGIYVSEAIPVGGNLKNFQLETTEHHPEVAGSPQFTDIEYAVHDGVKWHALLPLNQREIKAELLMPELVGGVHQATTRFAVAEDFVVKKDGLPLTDQVVLLEDRRTLVFSEYDPSSFYIIAYTPDEGSWTVDFVESYRNFFGVVEPTRKQENFNGTDQNGVIRLSSHPFIDRERLNQQAEDYDPSYLENEFIPVKVTLNDSGGYRIEQPVNKEQTSVAIRNRTDYFGGGEVYLNPFDDDTNFYQYTVEGDTIRFNTPIPKDTRITVEYPSLVSKVRLRAILRRNASGHHGLTPVLEDYVAHSQVLK